MANLIVDLDFIPVNLNGDPLTGCPIGKIIGELLCDGKGFSFIEEKYRIGKELYATNKATFLNSDTADGTVIIDYFKNLCKQYPYFDTQTKAQILAKFNK